MFWCVRYPTLHSKTMCATVSSPWSKDRPLISSWAYPVTNWRHSLILPSSLFFLSTVFSLFFQDEILSIMASSRRLRQGSRTSDSKATLSAYRERDRTSSISTCTCARCARGGMGMPSAECCDAQQHNGLANWTGSRDANDFCLKNTGSNGLEVKVTEATVLVYSTYPANYYTYLQHYLPSHPSYLLTLPSYASL